MSHRFQTVWPLFFLSSILADVAADAPPEYRALDQELKTHLTSWERHLPDDSPVRAPIWAAELLPANGNRGEDLLAPGTLEGCIRYLEALRRMGVQGVKVAIQYPLLDPNYPRSTDYLNFYKQVAAEVRRRDMVLLVGAGAVFTDPSVSKVRIDYRTMTFTQFQEGRRRVAHRIAQEVQPDYLTVGNEPTTEADITRFTALRDPDQYAAMIEYILRDFPRGRTRVGAGTGNWESPAFIQKLVNLKGLDYIDLHVYPVGPWMAGQARALAKKARSSGLSLVIGEAWLYKVRGVELARTRPAEAYRRDVFSFWSPLDQRFLEVMARWASAEGADLVSFFWSKYFFAYLDYDSTTAQLPYDALRQRVDQQVVRNLLAGQLSPTGRYYQTLIAKFRRK